MLKNAPTPDKIDLLLSGANSETIFSNINNALQNNQISPAELLTGAAKIPEDVLHKIGERLQNSTDHQYRKYAWLFFMAAGQRGYAFSYASCAMLYLDVNCFYGLPYSPLHARELINNALHLNKGKSGEHWFNVPLAYVLKANEQILEANQAMLNFLSIYFRENVQTFDRSLVLDSINFCLQMLMAIYQELNVPGKAQPVLKEKAQKTLQLLTVFSSKEAFNIIPPSVTEEVNFLKQQILLVQSACYSVLGTAPRMMLQECLVTERTNPNYRASLAMRAALLKSTVSRALVPTAKIPNANSDISSFSTAPAANASTVLGQQVHFNRCWQRASRHFDVVDEQSLEEEYQMHLGRLTDLIKAKETEIELLRKEVDAAEKVQATELPSLKAQSEKLEQECKNLKTEHANFEKSSYKYTVAYRQQHRHAGAEACFFNPQRSKKRAQIESLAHEIIDNRYQQKTEFIHLSGSVRVFAGAEKVYQTAAKMLATYGLPQLGLPSVNYKKELTYGPDEFYKIGETIAKFQHRTQPKLQRLGDSYSPDHPKGTYNESIFPFLQKLAQDNPEKEKQIAKLFIAYGRTQQSVSLQSLQTIKADTTSADVNRFNQICLLIMAKEQVQWLSATKLLYQGLAVAQARCILLISEGFIRFADAFQNDAKYSVYSNTRLLYDPDTLSQACQNIDELFLKYLQMKYPVEYETVLSQITASGKKCAIVPNRLIDRNTLKNVYGGDSDSEDEADYNSDLECKGSFLRCQP